MIRTIIFDFDGTIANTLPEWLNLFNKYADEYNLPKLKKDEAERLRNMSAFEIIKSFGISVIKIPSLANRIRGELNSYITEIKMFKGVNTVLEDLKNKGWKLGLLTSNSQENVDKYLSYHQINYFDFVHAEKNIFGKSGTLGKLINKYGLKKEETIYIGDEVRDIDACRDNGIRIVSVTWGFNTKEILLKNNPDFLASNPEELLKIVSKN